jgi:hypothetical protein
MRPVVLDHRAGRRRSVAGVLSVTLLVAVATACIPPYTGNPIGPRVAVVGDSITNDSAEALHLALDARYHVSVDGKINLTVNERLGTVVEYFDQFDVPEIVVVALGTNDAHFAGSGRPVPLDPGRLNQSLYDSSLGIWRMLSVASSARCIVLVDVSTHTRYPGLNEWAGAWNSVFLPPFAASYPQVRYASWDQAVGHFGTGITRDTIHPNDVGQLVFAVTVANAIATCP